VACGEGANGVKAGRRLHLPQFGLLFGHRPLPGAWDRLHMKCRTDELRFVKRRNGKEVDLILQQRWMDDDPPDEGAIKYEWRDVPTVDKP
jgi:hypothetical protein